jgi:hypothetical protein
VIFAGLATSTLLAIGLGMASLTLLLYILKLRRRPVSVPFSPLWKRILRDKEATHLFSQLKRLLSLLLQLFLVALLVLALGDPRLTDRWVKGRNIVVLVDTSASMKATDVEPSRIEVARKKVQELIDGLGATDRMLIAEMGMAPRPLSTLTSDVASLKAAAGKLAATDTRADLERGLDFAVDSLSGLSKPRIVLLSDGALGDTSGLKRRLDLSGVEWSYVPIGKGGNNVAITAFSVRRYPLDKSRYEALLEVMNTSDKPTDVELTLLGDGATVDVTRLHLGPKERLPRFYQDLAGASRTLEAVIRLPNGDDVLDADDHAYALMPDRRRVRVQLVTRGNTYLQAALLLDEFIEVTESSPDAIENDANFDVTILDGVVVPLQPNHGARLYLDAKEGGPVELGRAITDFGFDSWDKNSPILRWMAMENIQVTRGHALVPQKGDKIIGASQLGPLLVSGVRDGNKFLALGFDPRNSDWVLRVAWPLFLLNAINAFVDEDTSYISSYRTGETWRVPAPSDLSSAELVFPGGERERVPVKEGRAVVAGERAGFYELQTEDGETLTRFAANLGDLEESQVDVVSDLDIGATSTSLAQFSAGGRKEIWVVLVAAALVLSLLEWFSYHRRVTV